MKIIVRQIFGNCSHLINKNHHGERNQRDSGFIAIENAIWFFNLKFCA